MSLEAISAAVAAGHAQHGIRVVATGFLGNGSNGTVIADQANRLAYYYQDAVTGFRGPFVAKLWDKSGIPFENIKPGDVIEIELGYPYGDKEFSILGQTTNSVANTGGYTLAEQKQNATQFPQATTIQDLRVVPLSGFIEAKVLLGHYTRPSTDVPYIFEDDTRNADTTLTATQQALTSGQHCVAWIFLNMETGLLETVASTATTALDALPARGEILDSTIQAISRPSFACKRLTPVYLYYGQTTLATDDIFYRWDMRFDTPLQGEDAGGEFLLDALGDSLVDTTGAFLETA